MRQDRRVAAGNRIFLVWLTDAIVAKLRQTAGDGNFDYLVQFPGPAY